MCGSSETINALVFPTVDRLYQNLGAVSLIAHRSNLETSCAASL